MNLRQQIEKMSPERFSRAGKRAAQLSVELSTKAGREIPAGVRWLAEASVEEIATQAEERPRNHER